MSAGQVTSLRFGHPGDGTARPGLIVDVVGHLATVSGDAAIRQSLLLLMSTRPGERVMRPGYGCPLQRLVFQPADATSSGLAKHYVEQAVRRWEPRIDVLGVDAGPDPRREGQLLITLDYRVRATGTLDRFAVGVDLAGGP